MLRFMLDSNFENFCFEYSRYVYYNIRGVYYVVYGGYVFEVAERRLSDYFCIFFIFMNLVYWLECVYERKYLFCYFGLYRRMWFYRVCFRFFKYFNIIRIVRVNLIVCLWVLSIFSNNIRLRLKYSIFNKCFVDFFVFC